MKLCGILLLPFLSLYYVGIYRFSAADIRASGSDISYFNVTYGSLFLFPFFNWMYISFFLFLKGASRPPSSESSTCILHLWLNQENIIKATGMAPITKGMTFETRQRASGRHQLMIDLFCGWWGTVESVGDWNSIRPASAQAESIWNSSLRPRPPLSLWIIYWGSSSSMCLAWKTSGSPDIPIRHAPRVIWRVITKNQSRDERNSQSPGSNFISPECPSLVIISPSVRLIMIDPGQAPGDVFTNSSFDWLRVGILPRYKAQCRSTWITKVINIKILFLYIQKNRWIKKRNH